MIDQNRLEKYLALREAIKDELSWNSAGPVRDGVALAALDLPGTPDQIARSLKEPADIQKEKQCRLQLLRQHIRYAIAAVLLRMEVDPHTFTRQIEQIRPRWKEIGLRRGSPYEGASIMMLLLGKPGSADTPFLTSLKMAFDDLNQRRYWHVGTRTMPPLTLALQYRADAPAAADAMYQAMKEEKGLHSRHTMEAALTAILTDGPPNDVARQIAALRGALKRQKIDEAPANITGLAFANLTRPDPETFASDVKAVRERVKGPWYSSTNSGLLALDYVTAERIMNSDIPQAEIAPLMMAIKAYQLMLQQQAAATAAIMGGVATTSAAT